MSVPSLGLQKNDGRGLRFEQLDFGFGDFAICPRHGQRGHHHGERLFFAMLALAEAGDGVGIAGVDQKLESSDAFEGDDFPLPQGRGRVFDGAIQSRAADRAGVGLRVKAAVGRILIFLAARGAQE